MLKTLAAGLLLVLSTIPAAAFAEGNGGDRGWPPQALQETNQDRSIDAGAVPGSSQVPSGSYNEL